jgi:hypothetical protein
MYRGTLSSAGDEGEGLGLRDDASLLGGLNAGVRELGNVSA